MESLIMFAVLLPTLLVAHSVADHWVQTSPQAQGKGGPGWTGRLWCLAHVGTYTATLILAVALVFGVLALVGGGPAPSAAGVLVGQAVSAVTHYIADRRRPLERLAQAAGLAGFWSLGAPREGHDDGPHLGTGAYQLDQAWHRGWLLVAALVTVVVSAA